MLTPPCKKIARCWAKPHIRMHDEQARQGHAKIVREVRVAVMAKNLQIITEWNQQVLISS